jgi:hypothetical protein
LIAIIREQSEGRSIFLNEGMGYLIAILSHYQQYLANPNLSPNLIEVLFRKGFFLLRTILQREPILWTPTSNPEVVTFISETVKTLIKVVGSKV